LRQCGLHGDPVQPGREARFPWKEIEVAPPGRGRRGTAIAWHGPIVMNTQEELRIAFEELERGTFIKKK
jgi:hypothetical protein